MLAIIAARPTTGERRNSAARQTLLQRVFAEFQEMPCMRLTAAQARRLFGLRWDVCQRILTTLVQQGSLSCDAERYRYNDARNWPSSRVAGAPASALNSRHDSAPSFELRV